MKNIQKYIDLTTMMILATQDEFGDPYTSNIYFLCDDDNNFYFHSKIYREHSQYIVKNKNIAWSIINTEKYNKSDIDKKGLQFQGICHVLEGKAAEDIEKNMFGKTKTYNEMKQEGYYIFKYIPNKVKIWDEEIYGGEGKIINF